MPFASRVELLTWTVFARHAKLLAEHRRYPRSSPMARRRAAETWRQQSL